MKLITAPFRPLWPHLYPTLMPHGVLFLAGGISNCPNWQKEVIQSLHDTDMIILNPRREDFDVNDKTMEKEQIRWEYDHLKIAKQFLFWFPKETVCPITLFELGKAVCTNKPIYLGCHPQYPRRRDLEIQIRLIFPKFKIDYSLEKLCTRVKKQLHG